MKDNHPDMLMDISIHVMVAGETLTISEPDKETGQSMGIERQ